MSVNLIEGLRSNVKSTDEYIKIDITDLSKLESIENYFEVIDGNVPNRIFIDLDGELIRDGGYDKKDFKKLDNEILNRLKTIENISLMTSSDYNAYIDKDKTKHKISYRIVFINEYCDNMKQMREIVLEEKLPMLQKLMINDDSLSSIISVNTIGNTNTLNVDTSVYRVGLGKMRCVNSYKLPEQRSRYNKLIKGCIIDTLISYIPDECKCKILEKTINEVKNIDITTDVKHKEQKQKKIKYADLKDISETSEIIEKVLINLKDFRFQDFGSWYKIACVFVKEKLDLELFDKYSKLKGGTKYDENNNHKIIQTIKSKVYNYTLSTLYFMLKEDNITVFNELNKKRKDLWNMVHNFNNADFAQIYYEMESDKYIYSDKTGWYEYNQYNVLHRYGKSLPTTMINNISNKLKALINDLYNSLKPPRIDEDDEEYKKQKESYDKKREMSHKLYTALGKSSFIKGIIDFLAGLYIIEKVDDLIDSNSNLFAFDNILFDITEGKFRSIKPEDYVCITCGYSLDVAVNSTPKYINKKNRKIIEDILSSIFDDELKTHWLTITSLALFFNKYQKFYINTGAGSNGKGLLFNQLARCLGDYFYQSENTFLTTNFDASKPNPTLSECKGKRLLVVPEAEEGDKENTVKVNFIKQITGNDRITCRGLYKGNFSYIPQFTVFLMCNNKPEIKKMDGGTSRRVEVIPFKYNFVEVPKLQNEKQMNINLGELLNKPEMISEFIMLLIETANKNKHLENINKPNEVKEATTDYIDENNTLKFWIAENINFTQNSKDKIKTSKLFELYRENNDNYKRIQDFLSAMKFNKINTVAVSGYRYFVGITIKEQEEQEKEEDEFNITQRIL